MKYHPLHPPTEWRNKNFIIFCAGFVHSGESVIFNESFTYHFCFKL